MSAFTPDFEFRIEFDGDVVTGRMKRLTRADQIKLAPSMGLVREEGQSVYQVFLDSVQGVAAILPDYVTEFHGLTIGGREATLDQMLTHSYFNNLVDKMGALLIEESLLGDETAKKSATLSQESAADSGKRSESSLEDTPSQSGGMPGGTATPPETAEA